MNHGLVTLAKFKLEEILPYIGLGMPKRRLTTPSGEFNVKMSSNRLECLKQNQVCVACGMSGLFFLLQRHGKQGQPQKHLQCFIENCSWCSLRSGIYVGENAAHLNLYGQNAHGSRVMMTQDHIVPRHAKGSNRIENLQTMCIKCNNIKGCLLPDEYAALLKAA